MRGCDGPGENGQESAIQRRVIVPLRVGPNAITPPLGKYTGALNAKIGGCAVWTFHGRPSDGYSSLRLATTGWGVWVSRPGT